MCIHSGVRRTAFPVCLFALLLLPGCYGRFPPHPRWQDRSGFHGARRRPQGQVESAPWPGDRTEFLGDLACSVRRRTSFHDRDVGPHEAESRDRSCGEFGWPETYIIDRGGVVRRKLIGPASGGCVRAAISAMGVSLRDRHVDRRQRGSEPTHSVEVVSVLRSVPAHCIAHKTTGSGRYRQ